MTADLTLGASNCVRTVRQRWSAGDNLIRCCKDDKYLLNRAWHGASPSSAPTLRPSLLREQPTAEGRECPIWRTRCEAARGAARFNPPPARSPPTKQAAQPSNVHAFSHALSRYNANIPPGSDLSAVAGPLPAPPALLQLSPPSLAAGARAAYQGLSRSIKVPALLQHEQK